MFASVRKTAAAGIEPTTSCIASAYATNWAKDAQGGGVGGWVSGRGGWVGKWVGGWQDGWLVGGDGGSGSVRGWIVSKSVLLS